MKEQSTNFAIRRLDVYAVRDNEDDASRRPAKVLSADVNYRETLLAHNRVHS